MLACLVCFKLPNGLGNHMSTCVSSYMVSENGHQAPCQDGCCAAQIVWLRSVASRSGQVGRRTGFLGILILRQRSAEEELPLYVFPMQDLSSHSLPCSNEEPGAVAGRSPRIWMMPWREQRWRSSSPWDPPCPFSSPAIRPATRPAMHPAIPSSSSALPAALAASSRRPAPVER